MASIDLELELSDEERQVQETVHKFAAEVMRPAGIALDKLSDPQDVIAEGSMLWDVFEKHRALGLDALEDPSSGLHAGAAGAAALHHRRGVRLGRLRAGDRFRRQRLPPHARHAVGQAASHRALCAPGSARLLGDHRAGPRQRPDLLRDRSRRREAGQAQLHRAQGRRLLRDHRTEGGLGLERDDRGGGRPLLRGGHGRGDHGRRRLSRAARRPGRLARARPSTSSDSARSTRARSSSTGCACRRTTWWCRPSSMRSSETRG